MCIWWQIVLSANAQSLVSVQGMLFAILYSKTTHKTPFFYGWRFQILRTHLPEYHAVSFSIIQTPQVKIRKPKIKNNKFLLFLFYLTMEALNAGSRMYSC